MLKNIKDDFRTFIVVSIVCIICLIIGLIMNFKTNSDKLVNISEYETYFTKVNYINNYISMLANGNQNAVYKLLNNKYIEDNNVTLYNVLDNNKGYSILSVFEARNISSVKIKKDYIYYINGVIYNINHDGKEVIDDNFSILVIEDVSNNSYSLYPVDENNYSNVINGFRRISINRNEYNKVTKAEKINNEQICTIYLSNFLSVTFEDIDKSYNLLSDNMKKNYSNKYDYENYINNNFSIMSATAEQCNMEKINNKRVYTVIDDNSNTYIFIENSIMNYKVEIYFNEI